MRLAAAVFGATCAIATCQFASAADLSSKVVPLPVVPVVYNWTGFYVGANGGYGWSTVSSDNYSITLTVADVVLENGITFGWTPPHR